MLYQRMQLREIKDSLIMLKVPPSYLCADVLDAVATLESAKAQAIEKARMSLAAQLGRQAGKIKDGLVNQLAMKDAGVVAASRRLTEAMRAREKELEVKRREEADRRKLERTEIEARRLEAVRLKKEAKEEKERSSQRDLALAALGEIGYKGENGRVIFLETEQVVNDISAYTDELSDHIYRDPEVRGKQEWLERRKQIQYYGARLSTLRKYMSDLFFELRSSEARGFMKEQIRHVDSLVDILRRMDFSAKDAHWVES